MLWICFCLFLLVITIFLPNYNIGKKNPYDIIKGLKSGKPTSLHTTKYDEAFWGICIKWAKKLERVIPITIKSKNEEKIMNKIIHAGMQKRLTVEDIQSVKALFLLVVIIYFTLIFIITFEAINLFLGIIAIGIAFYSPEYLITIRAKNRQLKISHELPNILTSLAIITDAGLNLIPAIEVIVKQSRGEFLKELYKVLEDIQIGISQKEAFLRLSYRCNIEEVNYFVSALLQGFEKGNSGLTRIIRQQADECWQKRKYKAKELAEKASMKLFLPLLLMVFPAFGIFLVGPMIFSLVKLFSIM